MTEPRITSGLFDAALIRRVFGTGGFAAVTRRGNDEAGAVFIVVEHRDGTADLYAPAPQYAVADSGKSASGRWFELAEASASPETILDRIGKESRFDSDLWVVSLENAGPVSDLIDIV